MKRKRIYFTKESGKGDTMKYITITLLVSFLFFDFAPQEKQKMQSQLDYIKKSDLLTVEQLVGNNVEINEFLLASPKMFDVTYSGDIIIVDENKIKVFDANGKEKTIVGRVGQAPGEYTSSFLPFAGPTGYLMTVNCSSITADNVKGHYAGATLFSDSYNLFNPDYKFSEKKTFENGLKATDRINIIHVLKIIPINLKESVYEFSFKNQSQDINTPYVTALYYENDNTVTELLKTKYLDDPYFIYSANLLGELLWDVLPNNQIIYINPNEDVFKEKEGSYYTIHCIDFTGKELKKIMYPFTPMKYPDEYMLEPTVTSLRSPYYRTNLEKVKRLREKQYFPAIEQLKVDNTYAFLYVYTVIGVPSSDYWETQTNVVDLKTGTVIKTINFPFRPFVIRNGYAYYITKDDERHNVIAKCKINQNVYAK